jgi:hypothetical protein
MPTDDRLPEFLRSASQQTLVRYRFVIFYRGEDSRIHSEEAYGTACGVNDAGALIVLDMHDPENGAIVFAASEGEWLRFKRMEPVQG